MQILGTTTSPYTRKVRIVARAAGLDAALVDTRTPEGAALLVQKAPLGKVPVALIDEAPGVLPDSALIVAYLWEKHEAAIREAGFDLSPTAWADRATTMVVEGAMDATINRFYLKSDGMPDAGYLDKQRARIERCLAWIDANVPFSRPVTAQALSLGCYLDWALFRGAIDIAPYNRVRAFRDAWVSSRVGAGTEPVV